MLSEYPPGMAASPNQFLARNRLTAGLSGAVLAVEAGLRSGTSKTIRWANRLGRPALAVPGPVTSAASAGCHRMIADGRARLITCADDVITALASSPSTVSHPSVAPMPLATERGLR